jgi:hypothetical protein
MSGALLQPIEAAARLGFDVTKKTWRIAFWRFCKSSKFPVVKLTSRRTRIRPEVLEAYINRREVGRLPPAHCISAYRGAIDQPDAA